MPKVASHRLTWSLTRQTYQLQETRDQVVLNIVPESPAWFSWLKQVSSFAFWGQRGHYTARKESRPRGEAYWYVYVGAGKKLTKKYLGKTSEVTLARLEQVAAMLARRGSGEDDTLVTAAEPEAAPPQSFEEPRHCQQRSLPSLTTLSGPPQEPGQRPSCRGDLPTGMITLLFTGIEGSTRLLQQAGERYAQVLTASRHLLRTVFQQYQGHGVNLQGDAFCVAFTRASDAVAAAAAAQSA